MVVKGCGQSIANVSNFITSISKITLFLFIFEASSDHRFRLILWTCQSNASIVLSSHPVSQKTILSNDTFSPSNLELIYLYSHHKLSNNKVLSQKIKILWTVIVSIEISLSFLSIVFHTRLIIQFHNQISIQHQNYSVIFTLYTTTLNCPINVGHLIFQNSNEYPTYTKSQVQIFLCGTHLIFCRKRM